MVTDINFYFHHPYKYGLKINKQAIIRNLEQQQKDHLVPFEKNLLIQSDDTGVLVTFEQNRQIKTINGKFIVDATGRNRAVLKSLKVPIIEYDTLMAFSCHVPRIKHPALTYSVHTEAFENGWGIASGLNETENVLTLFTLKKNWARPLLKDYQNWASILSETVYLKCFLTTEKNVAVKGAHANSSKAQAITGKNWLALGDAAISFDPLSSHGITNAIYTAQKGAEAIESHLKNVGNAVIKEYGESVSAIFMQYLQTKNQIYCDERRWENSSFWKSMC
jgi:flavin-dependent dehydrogenase